MKIWEMVVEITKNSQMKYEIVKEGKEIRLDRILAGSNVYPGDYGYLPQTLELDGDPIDVLVWSQHSTFPGCILPVRIIGGLEMIDQGKIDNKLIAIMASDPEYHKIEELNQMEEHWKARTWDFFANYKKLEQKKTILKRWFTQKEAQAMIKICQARYQNQK